MALTDKLTAIADAIREKTGKTDGLTLDAMPGEIEAIQTGAGLNFAVLGNPQPLNPAENTIWVNTNDLITGYTFSASAPENSFDGLVWIMTSPSSLIIFNALEQNCLEVYPVSAKQYVGGVWVDVEAKIYQNETWVNFYDRKTQIEILNATGWARYSENVAGEYVRFEERGFTRDSVLPAIWCWYFDEKYCGFCLLAAQESALAGISETSYGAVIKTTTVTPNGNIVHVGYMKYAFGLESTSHIIVSSNGNHYNILNKYKQTHGYNKSTNTLTDELCKWVDELLFGVR